MKKKTKEMKEYKCGHKSGGTIILDSNELSMAKYFEWLEDKTLCWDCFCKEKLK